MIFTDRPLEEFEKKRLHPEEQKIINHYEWVTKRKFHRLELRHLKACIKAAYPAQIMSAIDFLYKQYPDNFINFSYIVPYVKRVYKNKKGAEQPYGETKQNKTRK